MEPHQIRSVIRDTLDRTWLDFHQRMAEHPRSTRLAEYVDGQAREAWRNQGRRRFGRLVRGCGGGGEVERTTGVEEEARRLSDLATTAATMTTAITSTTTTVTESNSILGSNPENDAAANSARAVPATRASTTNSAGPSSSNTPPTSITTPVPTTTSNPTSKPEPIFNPYARLSNTTQTPFVQPYDGSHPFWDTPHLPLPPHRLPSRRTRDKPVRPRPTYQLVTTYDTSEMGEEDPIVIPKTERVRVYHRPGWLEPFTHKGYIPEKFGTALKTPFHGQVATALTIPLLPLKSSNLSTYGSPVRPIRRYRFCHPLSQLTWVATEVVWPFRPVYDDEVDGDEVLNNLRGYFAGGASWEEEGRDADGEYGQGGVGAACCELGTMADRDWDGGVLGGHLYWFIVDIILIETLRRLVDWASRHPTRGKYLSLSKIEATGILPQKTETIADWSFERDLFGFPPPVGMGKNGAGTGRKWERIEGERGERIAVEEKSEAEGGPGVKEVAEQVIVKSEDERYGEVGENNANDKNGNEDEEHDDNAVITGFKHTVEGPPPNGFVPVDLRFVKQFTTDSSSGLVVDVDVDADMDVDMPSLDEMMTMNTNAGRAGSSRVDGFHESPSQPTRASARISQKTSRERARRSRRHRRRPKEPPEVRNQSSQPQGLRIPITKDHVKQLREIFIPPRSPPTAGEIETEESRFSNMRNQQELICPNGLCRQYACLLHVGDAVHDVIPFWLIPEVPPTAQRLIDMWPALEDLNFRPCSLNDCWFSPIGNETAVCGPVADMRELDSSHLKTFLNGMTDAEDDWKVCDVVDMFAESVGHSDGKGWSCAQIGRQIGRLLDQNPVTQISGPSSSQAAKIVNASKVKSQDTHPGHLMPNRSKQVRQQIDELTGVGAQGGNKKKRAARDAPTEPAPKIISVPPLVKPNQHPVCVHEGPCTSDVCECFANDNHCNRDCPCRPTCRRRHTGCQCRMQDPDTRQAVCGPKCPCALAHQECDPDLCGTCGAREAVESATRPTDHIVVRQLEGRTWAPGACQNIGLRSGEFQPIRVGYSRVHGYGVFAKADIPKHSLVIEYVGELIDELESRWRGEITKPLGLNYLFGLNSLMNVDSSVRGNMSRFINHHTRHDNVTARVRAVQGVHRLEFRATQFIKANEELLFNYGENFGLVASQESQKRKGKGKKKRMARSKSDTIPALEVTPPAVPVMSSSQPTATPVLIVESSEEDFYVLSSEDSDEYQISRGKKRRLR